MLDMIMRCSCYGAPPLTPTLSPQAGRGSTHLISLAPRQRGEGGARVSWRERGASRYQELVDVAHRLRYIFDRKFLGRSWHPLLVGQATEELTVTFDLRVCEA